MNTSRNLAAALLLAAATTGAVAQSFSIGFDALSEAAPANGAAPSLVSFGVGTFSPNLDGEGDAIPGTERWRLLGSAGPVVVLDPQFYGRGVAPSAPRALDSVFDTTLMLFTSRQAVTSFSVTLDQGGFGFSDMFIELYQVGATTNTLLASIPVDQTIPGFVATLSAPVAGVDMVVLPAGSLYDNLNFTAVPEPADYALVGSGLLGAIALLRRKLG
jgi:hypothetical protein